MTIDTLKDYLRRRPFTPFRVTLSSGQSFDVRHPDAAILLKNGLAVAYGESHDDLPDRLAHLSLLHITSVESLQAA